MENCLFCKIIVGDIPSQKIYEDEYAYAFKDISPQAPVHALVIPKVHVTSLAEVQALTVEQKAGLLDACSRVANLLGVTEAGYRVVTNCGEHGCQSVHHLHFHVLGGEPLSPTMV